MDVLGKVGAPNTDQLNAMLNAFGPSTVGLSPEEIDMQGIDRNEALSQAMYGKSLAEITQELGVAPTFKRGKNPGDIDAETGYTFDEDGQAGGAYEVPTYASFSDFTKAMSISAKTGFVGSKSTARDVMRRSPVDSKQYKRAENFLNGFRDKKEEDKKPEVKTETTKSEDSTPSGDSTGAVGSTGDLGGATGAGYSGSQDLADSYAESGGDAGAGSDSFGGSDDGGYDTSDSFDSDTGFGSDISTAKGGFIKKPKPKAKKMKRGGLASKK